MLISLLGRAIFNIRKRSKKEKKFLEDNKKILEDDIQYHKGKIENLHLNLSLKTKTERAFLENLRKLKKRKNIDVEETVKDLYFKTNNLLEIDKKNSDLVGESSTEEKLFIKKLSALFPDLSDNELKLCVYYRLNLSSKEISLLKNITPGSVRVYKTKIKTKIGLSKEEELTGYLNSIK